MLQAPQDVTADGSRILIIESRPAATDQFDLMALVLENPVRRETVISTPGVEFIGTYSPDGRFVTNQTQEAGQPEVYVSPADGSARARFKVSADGGERPIWSPHGDTIFYRSKADSMWRRSYPQARACE